jgi:hypothetical protein
MRIEPGVAGWTEATSGTGAPSGYCTDRLVERQSAERHGGKNGMTIVEYEFWGRSPLVELET